MRAINDINAPKGLDLSWRLQSLANMTKQKIGPLLGFSRVLSFPAQNAVISGWFFSVKILANFFLSETASLEVHHKPEIICRVAVGLWWLQKYVRCL